MIPYPASCQAVCVFSFTDQEQNARKQEGPVRGKGSNGTMAKTKHKVRHALQDSSHHTDNVLIRQRRISVEATTVPRDAVVTSSNNRPRPLRKSIVTPASGSGGRSVLLRPRRSIAAEQKSGGLPASGLGSLVTSAERRVTGPGTAPSMVLGRQRWTPKRADADIPGAKRWHLSREASACEASRMVFLRGFLDSLCGVACGNDVL